MTYRVPGANGDAWPVLSIGVRAPGTLLPPESQEVRSVEEEGSTVIPIELEPDHKAIAFGSALYENGERVSLPEKRAGSSGGVVEGNVEKEPRQMTGNSFGGSWAARGEVIYVPPNVVSNQPVGSVRKRPWNFRQVCRTTCEVIFTRGTLYGPSVTRLVKRGRFFVADFPPVRVPCSYPRNSNYPRRSFGQSHSRYKLRWSNNHSRLHAIEHRFQTGCYEKTDPPDVTRWEARRVP